LTKHLYSIIVKEKSSRSPGDILLMEKCLSYLSFFQNIELDDPLNRYDTARRASQSLYFRHYPLGAFACKYSTRRLL
jgi:hypothetical protein